jgi:hypothetical protein
MKSPNSRRLPGSPHRQRGIAAVEAAIMIPILIVFLTFPIFYARCYWHYTVAQKAAQDAARYLSSVPALEMQSKKLAKAAAAVSLEIAQREIAELAPGTSIDDPQVYCDAVLCGSVAGKVPSTVHVFINFGIVDNIFGVVDTGRYGIQITADVTMRYVGH